MAYGSGDTTRLPNQLNCMKPVIVSGARRSSARAVLRALAASRVPVMSAVRPRTRSGRGGPRVPSCSLALHPGALVIALRGRRGGKRLVARCGRRRPSASRAPGEAYAQGIAQHGEAVAQGADAALLHVPPLDGDLLDSQAEVLGEQQELDVEGEAGDGELLEQTKSGLAREHLEATLCVAEAGQTDEPEH